MKQETLETLKYVKYRNRKLHLIGDTNQYTTMEELLEIVASGQKIHVIDDATQEDLTVFTLARLIYDRCRMDKNAFKMSELQKLIMSNPPPDKD